MNHNECHFAAQCRSGSETSTPKRVRFPAAPLNRLARSEDRDSGWTADQTVSSVDEGAGKVGLSSPRYGDGLQGQKPVRGLPLVFRYRRCLVAAECQRR